MTLLIIFNDGTEKRIENVRSYEYGKGTGCFQYSLNNNTSLGFVQKDGLRYFGPEELWDEKKLEDDFWKIYDELINSISKKKIPVEGRFDSTPFSGGWNAAIDSVLFKLRDAKEKANK